MWVMGGGPSAARIRSAYRRSPTMGARSGERFMLGFNRWHLFEVLAVILCIAGISWLALGYFIPAPPSQIAIAGSFKGSHYNFVTAQYKEVLARAHVMVD